MTVYSTVKNIIFMTSTVYGTVRVCSYGVCVSTLFRKKIGVYALCTSTCVYVREIYKNNHVVLDYECVCVRILVSGR